jgi:hypothetical protein
MEGKVCVAEWGEKVSWGEKVCHESEEEKGRRKKKEY